MHRKRQLSFNKEFIFTFIISVLSVLTFCLLITPFFYKEHSTRLSSGTYNYQELSWTFENTNTHETKEITLPWFQKMERDTLYTLSTTLTYDGRKDHAPYGFIHVPHMFCRIYIEDELLFSCMPEDSDVLSSLKSPGFIYKSFPLPKDCLGKKITIEMLPKLTLNMKYDFPEIVFGDLDTTLLTMTAIYLPFNIAIIVCVVLGIFSILFSSVALDGSKRREGIYVGIFSIVFSLYLIAECKVDAFFIGNPYYTYVLSYMAFSLLPISFLAFMRERFSEKYRNILSYIISISITLFVVEIILHFLHIWDFREFIPVLHTIFILESLLLGFLASKISDSKKKHSILKQMIPLVIGLLTDMIIYWFHWDVGNSNTTFTILGVIVFLGIEIYHIFTFGIRVYEKSIRGKVYQQLAYMDALTEIGNRRAYNEEIEELEKNSTAYHSVYVVSADLNRLKYINDHYGHSAGDLLIYSAAQIMERCFGKKGKVFRTGGDEFILLLYNIEFVEYEEMISQTYQEIENFNIQHEFVMSIAFGCEKVTGKSVLEAIKQADLKMYEHKKRQKNIT